MDTLISVIIPVYKVERFLRKCLDSVIRQTYKQLEILLVDDGSPDNCGAICDEYAKKDERITVIHKENGGLSSARNVALDVAKGDYLMFVDSDDWVEPDFCKVALEMVQRENVLVASFGLNDIHYEKDGSNFKKVPQATRNARTIDASEAIRHLILRDDAIFHMIWNKIYHRSLFNDTRFPQGRTFEDQAVTYVMFHKAGRIYVSDRILYNYVRRKNSISGNWYSPQCITDRFEIQLDRLKKLQTISPENVSIQLHQVANEAICGFEYIRKSGPYGYALEEMGEFLEENKAYLLSHNPSRQMRLYFLAKPLLPLVKVARTLRLKKMFGKVLHFVKR